MTERDPAEIAGLKPKRTRDGLSDAAVKHMEEEKAYSERPAPTHEELVKFAEATQENPLPPGEEQQAILQQMRQMAELQKAQHQALMAMKEQLAQQQEANEKLTVELAKHQQKREEGGVHYKLPAGMSEEQQWSLMLNDPRGLLG